MISRAFQQPILDCLRNERKIAILYGPRQVGKTTLARQVLSQLPLKSLEINADESKYIEVLSSRDLTKMRRLVDDFEVLFVDEAQRIPDIGINLKILHDSLPDLKIIATGSSSFDLANRVKEPLTGRTRTFVLHPIGLTELRQQMTPFEMDDQLENWLIFGTYPEVLSQGSGQGKSIYLKELTSAYLYKDILELSGIRHSVKLNSLLRLLAFQVGSLVSLKELGNSLQLNQETVLRYLDLLEKSFVIFRLSGFSRNMRKEISKMEKFYFVDLGVRNAILDNFNDLSQRNDAGQLWENFLLTERRKKLAYQFKFASGYFWRTYNGAELDYVEEGGGKLDGCEFKFGNKKAKPPIPWTTDYPEATFQLINPENYQPFVL